jgi:hypothetical protein
MDLETHHVAEFVFEKDGPENLLIVTYSGHGFASSKGRLLMSGRRPKDYNARKMYIDWTDVEETLGKARADILVILDCCYAGVVRSTLPPIQSTRRKFQYIAACRADQSTMSGGKESFSRAIIEALGSLASKPGFTTSELVRMLTAHHDFPRQEQEALVFDSRFGPADEDIWISPSTKQATNMVARYNRRTREDKLPTADFLDLRFHFANHATNAEILATAEALKKLQGSSRDMCFHKISLLRRKSHITAAVQHWRDLVDRNRDAAEEEGPPVAGQLGLIGRIVRSVLDGRGAAPAWHETSFVIARRCQ